jgi:hypothetical protein
MYESTLQIYGMDPQARSEAHFQNVTPIGIVVRRPQSVGAPLDLF